LAGFKRLDRPTVDASAAAPGTIRYARLADGFPPVPQRLDVPSRYGPVTVVLEDWRLSRRLTGAPSVPRSDQFRSAEHTSELQSLMRLSYAVSGFKKKKT